MLNLLLRGSTVLLAVCIVIKLGRWYRKKNEEYKKIIADYDE